MRALWLISPIVEKYASGNDPEQGLLACPQASARLRMGVAAMEWRRAGNENAFLEPENPRAVADTDFGAVKVCIVQKFFADSELDPWLETCATAKKIGSRLVVDICDLPFHKRPPVVRKFYDEVLKICDAVVVNSEKMAELIAPYTFHRPLVIEDAIIGSQRKPEFVPGKRLRLLWFGHPSNLHYVPGCLDSLASFAMQRQCRLSVVTEEGVGAEELVREIEARFAPAFEARFIRWSLDSMRIALRNCDLVLLPSDTSSLFKSGASANRIAEALNAGRFPIASPLPSYLPFSDSAWLGLDLVEGIKWALANRGEVLAKIRRGQARVTDKFAAEKIGRQWGEFFRGLA